MKRAFEWLCYHACVNFPFNTAKRPWAYAVFLWMVPYAGAEAYRGQGDPAAKNDAAGPQS